MPHQTRLTWAEITRGTEVLSIPSIAWERALLPHIADYESAWEEKRGTWAVSFEAALVIATALAALPASYFVNTKDSRSDPDQMLVSKSLTVTPVSQSKKTGLGLLTRWKYSMAICRGVVH